MKHEEISMYTKKALSEALKEALKTKPFKKITVSELIESCNINRKTFYYHFEDMPSLIEEIIIEEVDNIINEYPEIDSLEKCIDVAFEFAGACQQALEQMLQKKVRQKLIYSFALKCWIEI